MIDIFYEPVCDECKGETDEANRAAKDDSQGHQSALLVPDGGGTDGVHLRLPRREPVYMTSVQGFHLRIEYQISPAAVRRLSTRSHRVFCLFAN